jgi:hypothetical protein
MELYSTQAYFLASRHIFSLYPLKKAPCHGEGCGTDIRLFADY